ncbi:MAG: GGDEF domain-containing protein [Lactobacillus sp.]|nr:GGDEF domain-containing protein [Lactobacillus sp.]
MIGFVASLEIVEDLGPELVARWLHRQISAATAIVLYVIAIILFIRMLRLFGTTYTWTANALRNGALIYVAKQLRDQRAFAVLLVAVFATFWPYWHWDLWALAGQALVLALLLPINRYQDWIKRNWHRHFVVLSAISLVYWLFDMYAYHYRLSETLAVWACFVVVLVLAHMYDYLLVYRQHRTNTLEYDNQHDALTGVHSLSKFSHDFGRYRQLSVAGNMPAVHLVMMDVDHFKRINDTYGHLAGNDVLKAFASDLEAYLDQIAFPCTLYRTGGEEFSLLVAGGATDQQVHEIATAYVTHLRQLRIVTAGTKLALTVSVGVTRVLATDRQNDTTIARADANLYAAKRAGRDRVVAGN